VLVALTGTVFYTEAGPAAAQARRFSADFPVDVSGGPGAQGTARDSQTTNSTISLNQTNITAATFEFEFTDNYRLSTLSPAGATFRVSSPNNVSAESTLRPGAGTFTTLTVAPVCVPPDSAVISANGQSEATRLAASRYPASDNGTGDWTIEVTVTRSYATPVHPVSSSISWSVRTSIETYSLQVTEILNP
jgi:hypothetical protein